MDPLFKVADNSFQHFQAVINITGKYYHRLSSDVMILVSHKCLVIGEQLLVISLA